MDPPPPDISGFSKAYARPIEIYWNMSNPLSKTPSD